MWTIALPLPPSANRLFASPGSNAATSRQVVKRTSYRNWREDAGWYVRKQWRRKPLTGPVGIIVEMDRPDIRADLDNRLKGLCDALVLAPGPDVGVIGNDDQIQFIATCWATNCGDSDLMAYVKVFPLAALSLAFTPGGAGGSFDLRFGG